MGKVLALLLIILLALASGAGYLFLTEKITAGERQIADGQRQLEQGRPVRTPRFDLPGDWGSSGLHSPRHHYLGLRRL